MSENEDTLLPCPICGNTRINLVTLHQQGGLFFNVSCFAENCPSRTITAANTPMKALKIWNDRAKSLSDKYSKSEP